MQNAIPSEIITTTPTYGKATLAIVSGLFVQSPLVWSVVDL